MNSKVLLEVSGKYALFTVPEFRVEKFSYQVPTYDAIRGVLRSIYWKPTIKWVVDRVRVMNPIRTTNKMMNINKYNGDRTQAVYTYLTDVSYQIEAHFEWNELNKNLESDRNLNKHLAIFNRCLLRGARRDVFLGSRECTAFPKPLESFGMGQGVYDNYGTIDFGMMFHGWDYPEETGKNEKARRMFSARMVDGVIVYPHPNDCTIRDVTKKVI